MKNLSANPVSAFLMLIFLFVYSEISQAVTVTNLKATYKNGQVFLTWANVSDTNTIYKIYRSPGKIKKGSRLPYTEFLGIQRYNSANNNNLSAHYLRPIYYSIDSGAAPLSPTTGLCVFTSIQNKSNYYCVTTVSNGIEDTTLKLGVNSLQTPVTEKIATPVPIYQSTDDTSFSGKPVKIYADFVSSRAIVGAPLRFNAASYGNDFAVYVPTLTGPATLTVKFHGGGADLFHSITSTTGPNQIIMGVEDLFPNGENSVWIGGNKNFDVLNYNTNTIPPTTDTDYTYTLDRLNAEITWVSKHFPDDTNHVHLSGDSFGCMGAFFVGMLKPTHICTVQTTVGDFNLSFDSDWESDCTMNEGGKNRVDGDDRFGTIASNLPSDLKLPFYNIVNGGYDLHHFKRDVPIFFCINGKYDELLGWTECIGYYDSVNTNLSGGFYLWDLRDHSGDNKTWNSNNFNYLRYAKNQSYPALSNCSANGNPGNGTGTSGDTAGTINGFVDWDNNNISDNAGSWTINLLLRSLLTWNNLTVPPPDSATANITPRRLQHFKVPLNATVKWRVKHKGRTIQQGSFPYKGGTITIPAVKIYTDTVNLSVTYSGGGNPNDRTDEMNAVNASIYPNPNDGQFTINFNNPDLPAMIEVRNAIGDLIVQQEVRAGENQAAIKLPETAASGIYMVRVTIGNNATVQKIIVQ